MIKTTEQMEILQNAISKAIAGGWDKNGMEDCFISDTGGIVFAKDGTTYLAMHLYQIIFSHDFAKALWGESDVDKYVRIAGSNQLVETIAWVFHLQNMVVADDPIRYLEANIGA